MIRDDDLDGGAGGARREADRPVAVQVGRLAFYRMSLPAIPAHAIGSHAGQWNAVLSIATVVPRYVVLPATTGDYVVSSQQTGRVLPYDLIVHCYSNLAFKAYAQQSGFAPGRAWTCSPLCVNTMYR